MTYTDTAEPETDTGRVRASAGVRAITTLEKAEELAKAWSELAEQALDSEPFLTPEWYLSWWRAFGKGRMMLLAAFQGNTLVGVAPFHVQREKLWGRKPRVLRFWSNAYSNRANVILHRDHPERAARLLVDALYDRDQEWDLARLGPLLREGAATRAFSRALASRSATWGMRDLYSSPYIELPESWDDLLSAVGGSYRQSLRRKARRASKRDDVSVEFSGRNAKDAEDAFRISRSGWQHRAGTGIVSRPDIEHFYRGVAQEAARRGWLRMAYLSVDGERVSYEFNLEFGGTLYNLKLAYDADYSALSPGLVLKQEVLKRAIAGGLEVYDLLGEAEPYKLHWTDRVRPLGELWIHRRGWASRTAHVGHFRLRPFLERRMPWTLKLKRKLFHG